MTDPHAQFIAERNQAIVAQAKNSELQQASSKFLEQSIGSRYSYNFSWLGRPIIQYPQDILAFQEIVFSVKPDLIIETGVAHGGSIVLSASLLAMLDMSESIAPDNSKRKLLGIDIDIRRHNREALDSHFLRRYIELSNALLLRLSPQERQENWHPLDPEYWCVLTQIIPTSMFSMS